MKSETKLFKIRVKVKDKACKVIELEKQQNLEVEWEGNKGKIKDGGKIVDFEKDGKRYQVIVKPELEKQLWRDVLRKQNVDVPADSSYQIYHGEHTGEVKKEKDGEIVELVELINPWKTGRILVASGVAFLFFTIGLIIYFRKKH